MEELYQGGPYTTPFAQLVRQYLDDIHKGHLKGVLPTLGYFDNYFPAQMNTNELAGNHNAAYRIMWEEKAEEWFEQAYQRIKDRGDKLTDSEEKALKQRMIKEAQAAAHETIQNILHGAGTYELAIMLEESNFGPGFINRRPRDWFNNQKMVERLEAEGLMERDPAKVLFNYVASAAKRGEFERGFGGYKEIEGAFEPLGKEKQNADDIGRKNLTAQDKYELDRRKQEAEAGRKAIIKMYGWQIAGIDPMKLDQMINTYRRMQETSKFPETYQKYALQIRQFEDSLSRNDYEQWAEVREMLNMYQHNFIGPMTQKLVEYGHLKVHPVSQQLLAYSPHVGLVDAFEAIHNESGEQASKRMREIVRAHLGQTGTSIDKDVQAAMSNMMAYQSVLVLMFSTLSSFPDIVGGVLRNRDIAGMFNATKEMVKAMKLQVMDKKSIR